MRISVDLPAPFSPTRPTTSLGRIAIDDVLQRVDAGKALVDVAQGEGGGLAHFTILAALAARRQRDGRDDHQALHGLLDARRDAHQHHAVRQHRDDQHADQRSAARRLRRPTATCRPPRRPSRW